MKNFTTVELCAGAGGQSLGLEQAGFQHEALVENDSNCCKTLNKNRPEWNVYNTSIEKWKPSKYKGIDLLAAGLPCPPFSHAGKQLGSEDDRNLFPATVEIIRKVKPRAIMIENVRGILDPKFVDFRNSFSRQIEVLGYIGQWQLLNACDFGVPQLRPRVIYVAFKRVDAVYFRWPKPDKGEYKTVGQVLLHEMSTNKWKYAKEWAMKANSIAPTIVGGSKKHGGPDLGPTRAKKQWEKLCVNGHTIAKEAPSKSYKGHPRLTVKMAALIQGFPPDWEFVGTKTNAYRQVGNAFPPPSSKSCWIAY